MHRQVYSIFLFFFIVASYVLQKNNNSIHQYLKPSPIDSQNITTINHAVIPLKRAGNLLLIDAKVDNISGTFVFDTGAPGLVLNSTYFRKGRKVFNSSGSGITGKTIDRKTMQIKELEFSGIRYHKIKADLIDLSHIENAKNVKITGLIGARFIKDFEAIVDVNALSLELYRVDKKGNCLDRNPDKNTYNLNHKIEMIKNVILTHIPVNNEKICFCIDTGAEYNVVDHNNSNAVMQNISIVKRSHLSGASSERIEVLYGIFHEFKIQKHSFEKMEIVLTDLSHMRNGFGINIKGMLGFGFFEHGIVKLNIRKKTMSIALKEEDKK